MLGEFNNSSEPQPYSLSTRTPEELLITASEPRVKLSVLKQILSITLHRANNGEFNPKNVELVIFVQRRITEMETDQKEIEAQIQFQKDLIEREKNLESDFFENSDDATEKSIKNVLKLFIDDKK